MRNETEMLLQVWADVLRTEMLLQVWADVLRDVQNDKEFIQQTERAAQDAAFRVRSNAVRAEVMRRLQDRRAAGGGGIQYGIGCPACSWGDPERDSQSLRIPLW